MEIRSQGGLHCYLVNPTMGNAQQGDEIIARPVAQNEVARYGIPELTRIQLQWDYERCRQWGWKRPKCVHVDWYMMEAQGDYWRMVAVWRNQKEEKRAAN